MRLPLYPHDLDTKGGFKRIAKRLQKTCPSTEPLKLFKARELLSIALGYQSYFDVTRSVHAPHKPTLPDLQDLKEKLIDQVSSHIGEELVSRDTISEVIEALPWHSLMATWAEKPEQLLHPKKSATKKIDNPQRKSRLKPEQPKSAPLIITKRRKLTIQNADDAL